MHCTLIIWYVNFQALIVVLKKQMFGLFHSFVKFISLYQDKHEDNHQPKLHGGLVIKHNANQRYATNAVTSFIFREIAERHNLPVQVCIPFQIILCFYFRCKVFWFAFSKSPFAGDCVHPVETSPSLLG